MNKDRGITNIVEIIREKFLVRQKNRHRQRPHIKNER